MKKPTQKGPTSKDLVLKLLDERAALRELAPRLVHPFRYDVDALPELQSEILELVTAPHTPATTSPGPSHVARSRHAQQSQ